MSKLFCLYLLLFSFGIQAQTGCQVFEYQGIVRIQKKAMVLLINETTLSERRFDLPIQTKSQMAPFLNLTVKGKLALKDNKIQKIIAADYGKATPLDHKTDSYFNLVKDESCQ